LASLRETNTLRQFLKGCGIKGEMHGFAALDAIGNGDVVARSLIRLLIAQFVR
jgi:hypothetical protein